MTLFLCNFCSLLLSNPFQVLNLIFSILFSNSPSLSYFFVLRLPLSNGLNCVGVSHPFISGRKQIQLPKRRVLQNTGRWTETKNPGISSVIRHRWNHRSDVRDKFHMCGKLNYSFVGCLVNYIVCNLLRSQIRNRHLCSLKCGKPI